MRRWRRIGGLGRILSSRHVLWLVPLAVAGQLAFGLEIGWWIDDHAHRAALVHPPDLPEMHRAPGSLFVFVDGDPERLGPSVARGVWPWWSAPALRLAFWRPVTGWSHALDYRLWPEDPRRMHLHSIAWYLLAVVLLLVLYRRILPGPALAGLAGLVYAFDDSQALPALWLANRNAVVAVVFGVAALIAQDRWRRGGFRPGALAAPFFLLLAVLANEGAVAIGGYLLAYAIFLDPAPWRSRLLALLPSAGVGLLWALAYKLGGYGTFGSGVYTDPATQPLRFAAAAVERAPLLLWGWWGLPPSDAALLLPDATRRWVWFAAIVLLALLAQLLRPVLRRCAAARFCGLGMLLALLPASSTFPSNRLLGFVGIGAAGLLALWIADLASAGKAAGFRRLWRRSLLAALIAVHLVGAPLLLRPYVRQVEQLDTMVRNTAESLIEQADQREKEDGAVIVVATPSAFISLASTLVATLVYDWPPRRTLVLSSGIYETEVVRSDERTLVLRPRGGFLRSPGAPTPAGADGASAVLDTRRALLMLDHLFRDLDRDGFRVGERIELDGVTLEILEEEAGRPLAVACRFSAPLESERWSWLAWRRGRYERFALPEVGGRRTWPGLYGPP